MNDDVDTASAPVDLTPKPQNDYNTDIANHSNHHTSQRNRKAKTLSLPKINTKKKRANSLCEACFFTQNKTSLNINNKILLVLNEEIRIIQKIKQEKKKKEDMQMLST